VAQQGGEPELHKLSAWAYLSREQFSDIVLDAARQMSPPISRGSSVYELGCGVGAALKVLWQWRAVDAAGSDTSAAALKVAAAHFAASPRAHFTLADMSSGALPPGAEQRSFDHVVSFGALAMYLDRDEMAVALHTATRMVRPGGSFCFTHFVEPQGEPKGTIVQPITRVALRRLAAAAGMVDVRLHAMRHQGDRYAMTASAPLSTTPHQGDRYAMGASAPLSTTPHQGDRYATAARLPGDDRYARTTARLGIRDEPG